MGWGLVRVANRAAEIGASTLQIFSDNPTAWRRRPETPPEAAAFRSRLTELDLGPVSIHAAYLVNLAGPDEVFYERSVEVLRHELEHAPDYGARFVNVHVGSHRGSGLEVGVARIANGIATAVAGSPDGPDAPLVVLENSSGGGDGIGVTIEELAMVLDAVATRGVDGRVAFCLDAAHLWGAGYDVADPSVVDELLVEFDRLIGLNRLAMVHLNDSESGRGSRHDRHASIGEGQIGRDGLARLLLHPALDHVAYFLETPGMEHGFDAVNVARLGDMAAGRPLTPAPAEALAAMALAAGRKRRGDAAAESTEETAVQPEAAS